MASVCAEKKSVLSLAGKPPFSLCYLTHSSEIPRRILDRAQMLMRAGWKTSIIAGAHSALNPWLDEEGYPDVEIYRADDAFTAQTLQAGNPIMEQISTLLQAFPEYQWSSLFPFFASMLLEAVMRPHELFIATDFLSLPIATMAAEYHKAKCMFEALSTFQFASDHANSQTYKVMQKWLIRSADSVAAGHEKIAEELALNQNIPLAPVLSWCPRIPETQHVAAEGNFFSVVHGIAKDRKVMLYSGPLTRHTNMLSTLIDAFAGFKDESAALVLMGPDAGGKESLLAQAESSQKLNKSIFFQSPVGHLEHYAVLASSDLGIVPWGGGDGNREIAAYDSAIEFASVGVPLLVASSSQTSRWVTKNRIGWGARLDSAVQVRRALKQVLSSGLAEKRKELYAGRRRFYSSTQESAVLSLFREILQGNFASKGKAKRASYLPAVPFTPTHRPRNILIVFEVPKRYPMRNIIKEILFCFKRYSHDNVFYLNARYPEEITREMLFRNYDLVIFHTIFLGARWGGQFFWDLANSKALQAVKRMSVVKAITPQDDFLDMKTVNEFINEFNINKVYTIEQESEWDVAFPFVDRSKVGFHKVLTVYIDDGTLARLDRLSSGFKERPLDVGYRAWRCAPWLGRHGVLKGTLADIFNLRAEGTTLVTDVSVDDNATLFEDSWLRFMLQCRYFIGVEGGSSMIDFDGTIRKRTEEFVKQNPAAGFEEIERECFPGMDGKFKFYCLSPRHLEAILTHTGQALVEGYYDGVLQANRHYIPIKYDLSNMTEVIELMKDEDLRLGLCEQSYQDIVGSGTYSYRNYVDYVLRTSLGRGID